MALRTDDAAGAELDVFRRFPRLVNILRREVLQHGQVLPADRTQNVMNIKQQWAWQCKHSIS